MRHRRGIDLSAPIPPAKFAEYEPSAKILDKLSSLYDWEILGARCGKCGHVGWLDRGKLIRRYGNQFLQHLGPKLVCRCGNREGNRVLLGTLGRD